MVYAVLLLVVVSFAVAYPLCGWLVRASGRRGWVDVGGGEAHKPVGRVVPNVGGVGVFWGVFGPAALGLLALWLVPASAWPAAVGEHVPGARRISVAAGVLLASLALLHGLGLVDDRKALGPWLKLAVMLGLAVLLATVGQTRLLEMLDTHGAPGYAASAALTAVWVVLVMNAFNFLDNMDGLSGGVAAIVCVLYGTATLVSGQFFVAALCALLLGALLAFLRFNVHPAKLFMGDGGSLVVGLLVAVVSVRTTYVNPEPGSTDPGGLGPAWYAVLMPLMVLAVPMYDFVSVTVIRLRDGRSPMAGDRNHFSHRLVRKGLSPRAAVAVIWLCTLATGLGGVMLGSMTRWQAMLAAGQVLAVLGLLAVLEWRVPDRDTA